MTQGTKAHSPEWSTMSTDPFAAPATGGDQPNPFGIPTRNSSRPKPAHLLGKLLIMEPIKVERVYSEKAKKEVDRWHVDTFVVNDDGTVDSHPALWWQQGPIGEQMRQAQKEGKPRLGVLKLVPAQGAEKKYTEDSLMQDEAMQLWLRRSLEGDGGPMPITCAWVLKQASEEQTKRAIAWWLKEKNPFG